MEINEIYSFQVDSEIVKNVYNKQDNYLIKYSDDVSKEYCIIYFSSNNIYTDNTEEDFRRQIIKKNRFEWYGNQIKSGYKHIFIRDIQKQWYLKGINNNINSVDKLLEFLKQETVGFKIITIGSSAGGFAAVYFGQQLNAFKTYTFNGQFEIQSLLETSSEHINPIVFREKNNPSVNQYFSLIPHINRPASIYYFCSKNSYWDAPQFAHIKSIPIQLLLFKTSHHGIPFLKSSLKYIINMNKEELDRLVNEKAYFPFLFSLKLEGILAYINLFIIVWDKYIRKSIIKLMQSYKLVE